MSIPTHPTGVFFINSADLLDGVKTILVQQLYITEQIDGPTFDARLAANPNYIHDIKLQNKRIGVFRAFNDDTNRQYADIALICYNGLVYVEKNNFGPPGFTFAIANVWLSKLIVNK